MNRRSKAGRNRPAPDAACESLLDLDAVTLRHRTDDSLVTATWRVSFSVKPGDRFVILGPSGCGKSSLLKAIGGFLKPSEGVIRLGGRPVGGPGPDRAMVFQDFEQLLPWKTVFENVVFPMSASRKFSRRRAESRARAMIEKLGLSQVRDAYPHSLSDGMKMRVAIARAMALEPDILLMDQPFAALDSLTRRKMQQELLALWANLQFTLLFVTHSVEEAILVGTRILMLSPHPGRVRAEIATGASVDPGDGGTVGALSKRIHDLLSGDGIEAVGAAHR